MSEKRFTIDKIFKEYPKLRDNETECFYHLVDNERNAEIFCERLNNLVEENEQLKKRNKFLEEFDGRAKTFANLSDENEKLKAKVKRLQDIATRTEAEKEEYADLYCKCENELIKNCRRSDG